MQIRWNRIASVFVIIAALFLFTRSALLPSGTYWELSLAREYSEKAATCVFSPEVIAYYLVDSQNSLIGVRALHRILFFLLCSGFTVYAFKSKELSPSLVAIFIFAFFAQSLLHIKDLFVILSLFLFCYIIDSKTSLKHKEILIALIAAFTSFTAINGWLLILLAICFALVGNKKDALPILACSIIGYAMFPKGIQTSFDPNYLLNKSFATHEDIMIIGAMSCALAIANLFFLPKYTKPEKHLAVFYFITAILVAYDTKFAPVFLFTGMMLFIKGCSKISQLTMNAHIACIMFLTLIVYYYLFSNSFGLNLNPAVNKQIDSNLSSVTNGYDNLLILENSDIGELIWKKVVNYDSNKSNMYFNIREWQLIRNDYGIFELTPTYKGITNVR